MAVDPSVFERVVLEHVDAENARDPERVRRTYADNPVFVDVAEGRELRAEKGTYTEITIIGAHSGLYKGFPPTGERHSIHICAHFEPSSDGRIAAETVYYDRVAPMVALGLLPDVDKTSGRAWLAIHRPSAVLKRLRGRFSSKV